MLSNVYLWIIKENLSSEYSERVDLFLFQIRSLGVLYSLIMSIVSSRLKEGESRVKNIGELVPKRILLSLFFQNLIFTKRLILLYTQEKNYFYVTNYHNIKKKDRHPNNRD